MIASILQLAAVALGIRIGIVTGSWGLGAVAALFLWLLVLLGIGTVRLLVGPHTASAKRFGES
jgi:hypothetical protein